ARSYSAFQRARLSSASRARFSSLLFDSARSSVSRSASQRSASSCCDPPFASGFAPFPEGAPLVVASTSSVTATGDSCSLTGPSAFSTGVWYYSIPTPVNVGADDRSEMAGSKAPRGPASPTRLGKEGAHQVDGRLRIVAGGVVAGAPDRREASVRDERCD